MSGPTIGDTVTYCERGKKSHRATVIAVGPGTLVALRLLDGRTIEGFVAHQDAAGPYPGRWWHE